MKPSRVLPWNLLLALMIALLPPAADRALAQWPHVAGQNLLVADSAGFEAPHEVEPDGEGGIWIAWIEDEPGQKGPRLQRLTAEGQLLFAPEGVAASLETALTYDVDIELADDGGVFVAWKHVAGSATDVHMQRISPIGTRMWGSAGVLLAPGPDVAVAVGNGGRISHSVDGGETWTAVSSGTSQSLLGVSVVSGAMLAVGDNATFLRGDNLGADWSTLGSGDNPDLNALDLPHSLYGIAVGDQGRVWSWDGDAWTQEPTVVTTDLLGVSAPQHDLAIAVGRNGRIARSTDGGTTWTEQSSGVGVHLHDVSFASADVGWAVGVGGNILHTADGGATWSSQTSGTTQTLLAVDFFDEMFGIATGYAGVALHTHDGGNTWTAGSTPVNRWYMGVDMTDASTAVAVGQDGVIIKTEDGGSTWSLKQAPSGGSDFWEVSAPRNATTQSRPRLANDGAGGVMVLWTNLEFAYPEVLAQRIDGAGVPVWPAPVLVASSTVGQLQLDTIERNGGGALAVWMLFNAPDEKIYAQALDLDGNLLQPQPKVVSDYPSTKRDMDLVSDGNGGAIVGWVDSGFGARVYGKRLTASATTQWPTNGQALSVEGSNQSDATLITDPAGGAFVVFSQNGSGSTQVYVQRVHSSGALGWSTDVQLSNAPDRQANSFAAADGFGGIVVAWLDERSVNFNVYAQAVTADGITRWQHGGVPVREGAPTRILYSRSVLQAAGDGSGGGVFLWADYSGIDGSPAIYAQNVDRHGYRGDASADITSVVDVPDDQGGVATVSWEPSYLDAFPQQTIVEYSLWRRNNGSAKDVDPQAKINSIEQARQAGLDDALIASKTATGWSFVGTTPAAYLSSYGYEAPTYGTGLPPDTSPTDFQVLAHTANQFVYWTSVPYGGNSVDNHAPATPQALAAMEVGGAVNLIWNDGEGYVEDIDHYRIYRGNTPGFVADESTLLAMATQLTFVDLSPNSSSLFYVVAAMDVHGNESAPSNEASVGVVTGVQSESPTVVSLRMNQPFPNPSPGAARVRFSLPRSGRVQVELFDLAGRRVYREDLGTLGGGWHEHALRGRDDRGARLASGMYLLRLSHGGQERTAKFAVAR